MKDLTVKPIPVPSKFKHPNPSNDALPKHEFTLGLIAPKGAGKTTTICNLLMFYKNYFHNIIVFSPTVASDEKWDYIKTQPLLAQNTPLQKFVRQESANCKFDQIVQPAKRQSEFNGLVNPYQADFTGIIPEDAFHDDYNEDVLRSLMGEQMAIIKLLKKHGQSKHLANRILIIFDDLVGSNLFTSRKQDFFKGLNTRHRHYSLSILMVSQGYKEIPKTIRTNWSGLIVFEIPNEKELEVIYEEFPMSLKRDKWQEAYEYATMGDHDFLFLNYQKEKSLRLMKNFKEILFFQ